jgi:hypothetical protein
VIERVRPVKSRDEHVIGSAQRARSRDEHAIESAQRARSRDEHAIQSAQRVKSRDEHAMESAQRVRSRDEHAMESAQRVNARDERQPRRLVQPSRRRRHLHLQRLRVRPYLRARWIPTLLVVLAVPAACTGSSPGRCPSSVASACQGGRCGTYAETIASPCFGCGYGWSFGTFSCGGFQVVACGNTDAGELRYYDGASGELVAIAQGGAGGNKSLVCVGGPASFTPPSCTESFDSTEGGSGLCAVPGSVPGDGGGEG